jgi:putative transposase
MRTSRTVAPGLPHHVLQYGNYGHRVFDDACDYERYLGWLAEYGRRFGMTIWAYCLMPNHVHHICVPLTESALGRTFNALHMRFAQYMNLKRGVRGHLWQGRFYSSILDELHAYEAVRFVETNPLRWRLVDEAQAYPWSSARSHGTGIKDPCLRAGWPLGESIDDWELFLKGECDEARIDNLRKSIRSGKPCGSIEFVRKLEASLGRKLERKPRGRPRKVP